MKKLLLFLPILINMALIAMDAPAPYDALQTARKEYYDALQEKITWQKQLKTITAAARFIKKADAQKLKTVAEQKIAPAYAKALQKNSERIAVAKNSFLKLRGKNILDTPLPAELPADEPAPAIGPNGRSHEGTCLLKLKDNQWSLNLNEQQALRKCETFINYLHDGVADFSESYLEQFSVGTIELLTAYLSDQNILKKCKTSQISQLLELSNYLIAPHEDIQPLAEKYNRSVSSIEEKQLSADQKKLKRIAEAYLPYSFSDFVKDFKDSGISCHHLVPNDGRTIDLSHSHLKSLGFYKKITYLDDASQISTFTIPGYGYHHYKEINLTGHAITDFKVSDFIKQLMVNYITHTINLSSNQITRLHSAQFDCDWKKELWDYYYNHTCCLRKIILDNNPIRSIETDFPKHIVQDFAFWELSLKGIKLDAENLQQLSPLFPAFFEVFVDIYSQSKKESILFPQKIFAERLLMGSLVGTIGSLAGQIITLKRSLPSYQLPLLTKGLLGLNAFAFINYFRNQKGIIATLKDFTASYPKVYIATDYGIHTQEWDPKKQPLAAEK